MSGYLAARDLYGMQRSRQEVISYAAEYRPMAGSRLLSPGTRCACGLLAACLRRGPRPGLPTRSDRRIVAVMYTLVAVVGVAFALGPEPTVNGVRLMASGPYDWLHGESFPVSTAYASLGGRSSSPFLGLTVLAAFGVRFLDRTPAASARASVCSPPLRSRLLSRAAAIVRFPSWRSRRPPSAARRLRRGCARGRPGAVLTLPAIGHRQGGNYDSDLRADVRNADARASGQ